MKENSYLQEVQQEAQAVEFELKRKRRSAPVAATNIPMAQAIMPAPGAPMPLPAEPAPEGGGASSGDHGGLGVRVTGWYPFQTVVVPPNMYVVHTRRGQAKPEHIGLGVSFRFNPFTDSFLVVPSSMQTIQISANTICKELQGILIQAYVQWIIDDIEVAYRRLDFSDLEDPMRVVNIQLREQAEASIKDKVSTMSIHEVLSDKRPIIEELTRRIKEVAEGQGEGGGLGIRIVTVQIKEAVVSSTRLWENLQGPFRAEQRTQARLAEIEADQVIGERERAERQVRESAEIETEAKIEKLRADKQSETYDREQAEALRRHQLEQEGTRRRDQEQAETDRLRKAEEEALRLQDLELQAERRRKQLELEIEGYRKQVEELEARLAKELVAKRTHWELEAREAEESAKVEDAVQVARLAREARENQARNAQTEEELRFEAERRKIANRLSEAYVQLEAVRGIPEIARALPQPESLKSVSVGSQDSAGLAGMLAQVMGVLESYGVGRPAGAGVTQAGAPGEDAIPSDEAGPSPE